MSKPKTAKLPNDALAGARKEAQEAVKGFVDAISKGGVSNPANHEATNSLAEENDLMWKIIQAFRVDARYQVEDDIFDGFGLSTDWRFDEWFKEKQEGIERKAKIAELIAILGDDQDKIDAVIAVFDKETK
jgi:hypothetical protein